MKETKTYQESAEEYADSFFDFPCSVFSLFDELLTLHEDAELLSPSVVTNNYEVNLLIIQVEDDTIVVETACCNEYGSIYGNNDHKRINKQLHGVGKYIHLMEDGRIITFN